MRTYFNRLFLFAILAIVCRRGYGQDTTTSEEANGTTDDGCRYLLQIVHVQDVTASYFDDMQNMKKQMDLVLEFIEREYPGSSISLATYEDKPIPYSGEFPEMGWDPSFCFVVHNSFSDPVSSYAAALKAQWAGGGNDWREVSAEALLRVPFTSKIGLTPSNVTYDDATGRPILRILINYSDALPQKRGSGQANIKKWVKKNPDSVFKNRTLIPNTIDQGSFLFDEHENFGCDIFEYPDFPQVGDALNAAKLIPIFMVGPAILVKSDGTLTLPVELKRKGYHLNEASTAMIDEYEKVVAEMGLEDAIIHPTDSDNSLFYEDFKSVITRAVPPAHCIPPAVTTQPPTSSTTSSSTEDITTTSTEDIITTSEDITTTSAEDVTTSEPTPTPWDYTTTSSTSSEDITTTEPTPTPWDYTTTSSTPKEDTTTSSSSGQCFLLEVVHVQDMTDSYFDDMDNMVKQMNEVFQYIEANYPGSRFSFCSFRDKPIPYSGEFDEMGSNPSYCFRVHNSLHEPRETYIRAVNDSWASGGNDWRESSLEALLRVPFAKKIGLSPPSVTHDEATGCSLFRLLFLYTDALPHPAGDGRKNIVDWLKKHPNSRFKDVVLEPNTIADHPSLLDNDENYGCDKYEYPELEIFGPLFQQFDITPIFMIAPAVLVRSNGDHVLPVELKRKGYTLQQAGEAMEAEFRKVANKMGIEDPLIHITTRDSSAFASDFIHVVSAAAEKRVAYLAKKAPQP